MTSHGQQRVRLLTFLLLAGCVDPRAASSVDPWYTPVHPGGSELSDALGAKWTLLDEGALGEVAPSREAEAEGMLKDVPCLEISKDEAARFLGKMPGVPAGRTPHLVRAVYLNRGTGTFRVYLKDDELLVEHGSLGHHAVSMKRQCLVVFLAQTPKRVFVSCHMAE